MISGVNNDDNDSHDRFSNNANVMIQVDKKLPKQLAKVPQRMFEYAMS